MNKIVDNISSIINLTELKNCFDAAIQENSSIKKHGRPETWIESAEADEPLPDEVKAPWQKYIDRLDAASYEFGGALWHMFYAGEHFPQEIEDTLCKYLNVTPTWTVGHTVPPGGNVPLHIDNNNYSKEFKKDLVRYIFQFGNISQGQVLTLENSSFHMLNEGDLIKWGDPEGWHGAANFGFETAYYYSIEGTVNSE